ncbi:MAG: hypothetical protein CM15mP122_3330 [Bacteroidota bacterium]|nr:MAG: hypothetical protein CM15mP122_3330 [Bacteroidota bacterium]
MSGRTYNNVYSLIVGMEFGHLLIEVCLRTSRLMNILADEAGLTYHRGWVKYSKPIYY